MSRGICDESVGAKLTRNRRFFIDFQSRSLDPKVLVLKQLGPHARAWGSLLAILPQFGYYEFNPRMAHGNFSDYMRFPVTDQY